MTTKLILKILIFIIILSTISFSQTFNFNGDINISSYYAKFFGDPSLNYLSSDIQEGIYFSQKAYFNLSYLLPNLSINFDYQSQPKEKINLSLKNSNFHILFNNQMNANISPITIYNKNLNGIYGKYEGRNLKTEIFIGKIEGRKKITKFFGNDTSGPFFLGDFFLTPYKERVFLNGNLLQRDQDYILDYTYGIIYFNFTISPQDEIVIEYEVSSSYEIFDLYSLGLVFSPIKLSFTTLHNISSNNLRNFLEFSLNMKKDSNNHLEIRRAFAFLDNYYSGYSDYLKTSFKFFSLSGNLEYINSNENYPYISDVMGNYNLIPGKKFLSFNLTFSPLSTFNYSFSYILQDQLKKQFHNINLSLSSLRVSLAYKEENYRTTQLFQFTYTPAFLSFVTQKNISDSSIINTYSLSFYPQTNKIKTSLSISEKNQEIESSTLREQEINGNLTLIGKIFDLSLGETYRQKENLNPNNPLFFSQNFITDGETYSFELNYTPLTDSIELYINNIHIENNSTFTYYLPDGTNKIYTVVYFVSGNSLYIFFEDEEGQNPPPSGLSITIKYKTIIPEKSYSKIDTIGIRIKYFNLNTLFSFQRTEKDNNISHILSLSTYGMAFQNLWINLTGSKELTTTKYSFSLNSTYYFRPSSVYFNLYSNETETTRTLSSKFNLNLNLKTSYIIFSAEYYHNYYYDRFFKNLNYSIEGKKTFPFGDLKLKLSQTWREASYILSYYKKDTQTISLSRDILKGIGEISLSHEYYSNDAEKFILSLSFIPDKSFQNNNFYIKYIYNERNSSLSILQIGGSGNISF